MLVAPPTPGGPLAQFFGEVVRRLGLLDAPMGPTRLYSTISTSLPPPADNANGILLVSDLNVIGYCNGTDWRRSDTGAVI